MALQPQPRVQVAVQGLLFKAGSSLAADELGCCMLHLGRWVFKLPRTRKDIRTERRNRDTCSASHYNYTDESIRLRTATVRSYIKPPFP